MIRERVLAGLSRARSEGNQLGTRPVEQAKARKVHPALFLAVPLTRASVTDALRLKKRASSEEDPPGWLRSLERFQNARKAPRCCWAHRSGVNDKFSSAGAGINASQRKSRCVRPLARQPV